MKSYFLHQHKVLKLRLLFITTVIAFALPANISYGGILVDLAVETSQYPTIQAYVTVLDDATGDPVTGLTPSDFSIFEDGNPQTIESFEEISAPVHPLAIAQALDYSGSMVSEGSIGAMETGAKSLIDQLRADPADACEILKFDLKIIVEQPFTTDKQALIDAVDKDWFTDWGGTLLYDALYKATEDTASYIGSQEIAGSVVVISDGRDFEDFGPGSLHSLDEVISLAASNHIKIFAVGYGDVYEDVLQALAKQTGGAYFWAPEPDDFEAIFLAIAAAHFGGGYIVSYETSLTGCDYHTLRVSVTKNGEIGEDSETFLICPSPPDGDGGSSPLLFGGGGGGGGCSMSNPEGQINIGHPVTLVLVGIFALGLLVWRKRRRR
jgi:VWFA-related protein